MIKEVKPESHKFALNESFILTEIENRTDSEYFVKFLGVVEDPAVKLVLEYIEGESLDLFLFRADLN